MKNFVSRGGIKLQAALDNFSLDVKDLIVLDVGSSTGGFVDCLLQNGAKKIYSVDTSYGELAWKLRNDPRVVVMERTNILHLKSLRGGTTKQSRLEDDLSGIAALPSVARNDQVVDLITIDASWTKLELILPVVKKFLRPHLREDGDPKIPQIIALLKPHYQADKKDLIKGVLEKEKAEEVKKEVIERVEGLGFRVEKQMESPILGGGGNIEYLLLLSF